MYTEREKQEKLVENLLATIAHYGLEDQLGQLSEECNELAIASHHYKRVIKKGSGVPVLIEQQRRNEMVREMADVLNVMEQIIRDMHLTGEVNEVRFQKMERQVKRIREDKKGRNQLKDAVLGIIAGIDVQIDNVAGIIPAGHLMNIRNDLALALQACEENGKQEGVLDSVKSAGLTMAHQYSHLVAALKQYTESGRMANPTSASNYLAEQTKKSEDAIKVFMEACKNDGSV